MSIFIDWISVYQDFPALDLPSLHGKYQQTICGLTGELLQERTFGYVHEGSFDTTILINFDGSRLHMSGNPSHWFRKDNLFGCKTVQSGIAIYNQILRNLGYPEFTEDKTRYDSPIPALDNKHYKTIRNKFFCPSLCLTRVDITQNFHSDIPASEQLRNLSRFNYRGEFGYLYPNGKTVEWLGRHNSTGLGSKRLYFKYYDKSFDLIKKITQLRAKLKRKINSIDSQFSKENHQLQYDHLIELLKYTEENNVIRFELELKSKTLAELGLNHAYNWTDQTMIIQLNKYLPHTKQVVSFDTKIDLLSQLLELDVPLTQARKACQIGKLWLSGEDVHYKNNLSITKTVFYTTKKTLLLIGFDITTPLNVLSFQRHRPMVKQVMLKPLLAPDWYDHVSNS